MVSYTVEYLLVEKIPILYQYSTTLERGRDLFSPVIVKISQKETSTEYNK